MANIINKDVLQSYIITTAKYDFSVYEKRIMYRQIEIEQALLNGVKIGDCIKIDTSIWKEKRYTIPVRMLLNDEEDKNHYQVKKAFERLLKKTITYEDEGVIEGFPLIMRFKIDKKGETVMWQSPPEIVEAVVNFAKGFRKYELKTAMSFKSVYAMRFYELMSGKTDPLTFGIEKLKDMFQVKDKYKLTTDFIRRVIEQAKTELDEKSPYSFEYKVNKTGRQFTSITFYPVYNSDNRDVDLAKKEKLKQVSYGYYLNKNVSNYLKTSLNFTAAEIKQNADLFRDANDKMGASAFIDFLSKVKPHANRARNPKGYLINSLKNELSAKIL
ncbi:MAG: replication initiation protein [Firmicutes bacterium]|nr:replication initiation protein [Bacillota bacterium]MCL2313020.1 replication initiation protein [Bacillota bacterium]MCL2313147.1 replication initiation protein [Bacillota bacterium]